MSRSTRALFLAVFATAALVLAGAQVTTPATRRPKNPKNPPIVVVPGLLGSYLTVSVTEAGCLAIDACVLVQVSQPSFVASLIAGPVVINTFFSGTSGEIALAERAVLLLALLKQSYSPPPANKIDYPAGVTVGVAGTPSQGQCDGVSKAYQTGLIDAYLVGQLGYELGKTLACQPYDWQLDMQGLEQAGYANALEQRVKELYYSPANDPPSPRMKRRKVVLIGHSMGTLASSSFLLNRRSLRAMVDDVVLLSPVSAGAALTWQVQLDGGDTSYLGTLAPDDTTPPTPTEIAALKFALWSLAQTSATGPVLSPYALPPYRFRRLRPPQFPNGFPASTVVGLATPAQGSASTASAVTVTVGTQLAALQGDLYRQSNGDSLLAYVASIWQRAHSYDKTVARWTARSAPRLGVRLHCAYGVAVPTPLTSAVTIPFPYPSETNALIRFATFASDVVEDVANEVTSPVGDGIVNLQGSNGCDRMADRTGGRVFTSTSPDAQHIAILANGPGAQALLDRALTAAGVRVRR